MPERQDVHNQLLGQYDRRGVGTLIRGVTEGIIDRVTAWRSDHWGRLRNRVSAALHVKVSPERRNCRDERPGGTPPRGQRYLSGRVHGVKCFSPAIETQDSKAEVQLCIAHMVRASLNYVL